MYSDISGTESTIVAVHKIDVLDDTYEKKADVCVRITKDERTNIFNGTLFVFRNSYGRLEWDEGWMSMILLPDEVVALLILGQPIFHENYGAIRVSK